jgi:hypothetical protein
MVGLPPRIDCLCFFFFLSPDNYSAQLSSVCLLFSWVRQKLLDPRLLGLALPPEPSLWGLTVMPDPRLLGLTLLLLLLLFLVLLA